MFGLFSLNCRTETAQVFLLSHFLKKTAFFATSCFLYLFNTSIIGEYESKLGLLYKMEQKHECSIDAIRQQQKTTKKLTSVYHASVLLVTLNYIITLSKQLWIPSQYLDNVLTKFMINNRTDA